MPKKLETLRLDKGWTQEQLAEKAGVNQSAVSRIENSGKRGHPGTMQKIAAALGVATSDIEETHHKTIRKKGLLAAA